MKVEIRRVDDAFHFEAENEEGKVVHIDASPDIGGNNKGVRPMQMVLMALGGCSGIDVVHILRKQRQHPEDLSITIDGIRQEGEEPNLFETISVHFRLKGDISPEKAARAVNLSMEKYCSVAGILKETARITYSISLNGVELQSKDQDEPKVA